MCWLRWAAAKTGAIAATLALILLASAGGASAPAMAAITMADAFLVEETGQWFCPGSTVSCPVRGSQAFARELLDQGRLGELDSPLYLRVAKARNDCTQGQTCTAGVPRAVAACPPASAEPFCALQALKSRGVKLGIIVGAAKDTDPTGAKPPRTPAELAWHACQINQADTYQLYDFMFLDLAFKLNKLGTRALGSAVRMIQNGRIVDSTGKKVACAGGGWPKLITNDTTWKPGQATLNTGAWAHARHLGLLESAGDPAQAATDPDDDALVGSDLAFVKAVKRVKSQAILRFEVPQQTSTFASLQPRAQCSLLTKWARAQRSRSYTFLFPLYVHGAGQQGAKSNPYDSFAQRTFFRQRELIADPLPPYGSACPSKPAGPGGGAGPPPSPAQPRPPSSAAQLPGVGPEEPSALTCNSARLNGWVNPHGSPTTFYFEYWKRGVNVPRQTGSGNANAAEGRMSVSRVADNLQADTGYSGKLIATNAAGRSVSEVFSFTTRKAC